MLSSKHLHAAISVLAVNVESLNGTNPLACPASPPFALSLHCFAHLYFGIYSHCHCFAAPIPKRQNLSHAL